MSSNTYLRNIKYMLRFLPDKFYIQLYYFMHFKKLADLNNPKTYNEKLNWLKLHDHNSTYSLLVDKYEAKRQVASIIGDEYIIPTLGLWESFDEIDFDALPSQFVLKCTHDSEGIVVVTDKSKLDVVAARQKLENAMKKNFFYIGREWPYKNIKHRIIAEQYMEDHRDGELRDYKFFCFDGEPKAMFIASDRASGDVKFDYYDLDFKHLDIKQKYPNAQKALRKPVTFEKMKELSRVLSKGYPHVRVDFYEVDDHLYFGELTFYHFSGFMPFEPKHWDKVFWRVVGITQNVGEDMEKNKPIHVLHVLQRMEAAGVQTLLMNLYRSIDRSKVQFDFLVHYKEHQFFDDEIEALGGKIYRLSVREDYNFVKYCRQLDNFFKKHHEYKIVHGHMHSLGAIYLHYAKKHGVPVRIAHSHTNATQKDAKKYIKQIMNYLYKNDATDLFACSEAAGKYMFGDEHFRIINNAILTDNFLFSQEKRIEKRKELGIEGKFVLGNVGRFEIQKNQNFLIDVFCKLHEKIPEAYLILVGTGSMYDEIKKRVDTLGLCDSVSFLGNRKDVAEIYMAMDVFIFPSLFEGLGIVGVEAQAAGTPCVCTSTLPQEIDVTPLLYRVPLEKGVENWIDAIIDAKENMYAHKNMKNYIVEANYDIVGLAKELEEFYLLKTN